MELILYFLTTYKYHLLFPLAIIEGPILSVISGFLVSTGFFNPLVAYSIIISGDIVGDSFYYLLGRFGNKPFAHKLTTWLGLTPKRFDRVKAYINANPYKTIALSKIILGVGVAGLFLTGKSKFSYFRFVGICFLTSLLICGGYLGLGFFFGKAYEKINHYLNNFVSLSIVSSVAVLVYFVIRSKLKGK